MDKSFIKCKEQQVEAGKYEWHGVSLLLSTLACICISFTLLNLSLHMYSKETKKGALSEAIIAMTKKIEESEAITVFLGIDNTSEAY